MWIIGITNINERLLSIRLGYDYLPGANTVVNETKKHKILLLWNKYGCVDTQPCFFAATQHHDKIISHNKYEKA